MVEQGPPWEIVCCLSFSGAKCLVTLLLPLLGAPVVVAITMVVVGTAVSSLKSSSSTRVAPEDWEILLIGLVLSEQLSVGE